MNKYENIKAFLEYAQTLIVSKPAGIQKMVKEKSFFMINDVWFSVDRNLLRLRSACRKAIFREKEYPPTLISENEIDNLLNSKAAKQHSTGKDQTNEVIKDLEFLKNSDCLYIMPNHAMRLSKGLESFDIGPVKCLHTKDLGVYLHEKINEPHIVIDNKNHGATGSSSHQTIFCLPEQCFVIRMKCSPKRADNLAQWYVDIALSLLRLFINKQEIIHGDFPDMGHLDPMAFKIRNSHDPSIRLSLSENKCFWGKKTKYLQYEIIPEIDGVFKSSFVNDICSKVFFPTSNTLEERLQRALGWMTKARSSEDIATRFLFFFTALEALLVSSKKAVPVTDTIARHVATIICLPEYRYECYLRIKNLYELRSSLVHSGSRDVLESSCDELQYFVEWACFYIVLSLSRYLKITDFEKSLREAAFGKNWPIPSI